MLKTLICLLMILALTLPSQAALLKGDETKIIISGKGIIKAEADVAYVTLGVERTEETATKAQKVAAQKMNNVLASLKKMGIPKDKIETTHVSLQPSYQYDKGKRTLVGYTASNQIKVTVDKLDDIGKVIDSSIAAGANNVNNIRFSVKEESTHKNAALKKAFEDAKAKAEVIAAASGLALSKIKSIQEAGARVIPPVSSMRTLAAEGVGAAAETPVSPGKIEIHGNLTVIYECSAKK
jgi:uncharacterized protein YggE